MKKSLVLMVSALLLILSFTGCSKDEDKKEKVLDLVKITAIASEMTVGDTFQVTAEAVYSDSTKETTGFTFSTSNGSITIDANGLITAISKGTAIVEVSKGGKKDSATINVKEKAPVVLPVISGEGISSGVLTINEGIKVQLNSNTSEAKWGSSAKNIADISETGLLTAITEGTADITLTSGKNSASIKVIVAKKPSAKVLKVHYKRYLKDYTGWGLHLWNATAGVLAIDEKAVGANIWATPIPFDKKDDFGVYAEIPIIDITKGLNLLLHKGDTKDGGNRKFFTTGETEFWLIEGNTSIFTIKPSSDLTIREATINSKNSITANFSDIATSVKKEELELVDSEGNKPVISEITANSTLLTIKADGLDLNKGYKIVYNDKEAWVNISRDLLQTDTSLLYTGNDLGAVLNSDGSTTFKLWSPPAAAVSVVFFDKNDQSKEKGTVVLKRGDKSIWSATVKPSEAGVSETTLDGYFYQYKVTANGQTKRVLDPYAKSMASFKGDYIPNEDPVGKAAIIDMKSSRAGKINPRKTNGSRMANNLDFIGYEVHIRDFTMGDTKIDTNLQGTYTGFIKNIPYLKELGITHVQLLPVMNHYRVNETDRSFQGAEVTTPNYNWGYDPHSYFALEGQYSTDATDPYKRVAEFRELVNALHEAGIGVILDVVYNHTMMLSILNDAAPGCYHRPPGGTQPVGDPAVESRNLMVRKLIVDSTKMMVNEYGVDGFRFDLMEFIDNNTMKEIRKELGDDIILYGEAWSGFSDLGSKDSPQKGNTNFTQHGISDLAYFNDSTRNSYAGDMAGKGFAQGATIKNGVVKAGVTGNIKGFKQADAKPVPSSTGGDAFAYGPEEALQYVDIHDGYTLWDKVNLSIKGSAEDRAKIIKFANGMIFTSQGKIMTQGGSEIGRTKPLGSGDPEKGRAHTTTFADIDEDFPGITNFHENTYRSCDYTNNYKWARKDKPVFKGILDYYKGLIEMRRAIPAFRYKKADSIKNGLKFIGGAQEDYIKFVAFELDNTLEMDTVMTPTKFSKIFVVYNGDTAPVTVVNPTIANAADWTIIADEDEAGINPVKDTKVKVESGKITVPAGSMAVIAK